MIRNEWYVVLESKDVRKKPIGVTRLGEKLVFWRDSQNRLHCLRDVCTHRGAALSKGKCCNDVLQCPFHGFEYDGSGRVTCIPANGRDTPVPPQYQVASYPVYEAHELVWIWWGDNPQDQLDPPQFFDDITDDFYYSSVYDPWDAHYSRVIENQLDVVHLPFVHYNTIGRGNRTLVNGPVVEWVSDRAFRVYVFNAKDVGQKPKKPAEISKPYPEFHLEFHFPNTWQNYIGSKVRVLAAFIPVDEEHTLLYLRFYQRFMKIPVLGKLITRLAMPFNTMVAHQDRRVVQTQMPKRSQLKGKENLIQGDLPIIEYRKKREALIQKQSTAQDKEI